MDKNIVLFGVIIGLIAALLVPILPQETKASTCTSSASAGGVSTNRFQSTTSANLLQRQATRDSGCSSGSVAVGGQGASCFAVNNGQSAAFNGQSVGQQPQFRTGGSQSCFASNQAAVARLPN
jgi:hypothetical protein